MDSIDARFVSTNARLDVLDNAARKARNARIANRSATQPWMIQRPLSPFIRVNADIGPGHPGEPQIAEKDLPVVVLGQEFPSPIFSRTIEALKNMIPENIKMLSMLMNNDFEIEAGDDLDIRRDKLKIFLLYGV